MAGQKKTLIILAIVCLVLAVAVIILKNVDFEKETEPEETTHVLIDVPLSEIKSFRITNAKGDYTYLYDTEAKAFSVEKYPDITLDTDGLYKILSAVSTIQSGVKTEVENIADYGLEKPYISLEIVTDGGTYAFLFGDKNDHMNAYYCCKKDNPKEVYLIAASKVEKLDCSIMDFKIE